MNVIDAIRLAENKLKVDSQKHLLSQDARVDAEFLLSKVLNKSFTWLKTWPEFELSVEQESNFLSMLQRRFNGEPIAYIIGEKSFWTLDLCTNQSTLIPRADTELLVETALEFLAKLTTASILDLGTGTGAVGLAIASERKQDQVYACDFNQEAVKLAQKNALKNNISNITIFESNWFSQVAQNQFDLIVSNPPYIEEKDPHLAQGDLVFEPSSALVSGIDGLDDIKIIIQQSKNYLKQKGCLMLEHGFDQASRVQSIFSQYSYVDVETFKDLAGLDRVTIGFLSNKN